jgi:tight adherence protein C
VLLTAAAGAFGYVLPNVMLYNAGAKRETLMRNSLPDALDLLTVSVEAGLGFDAAVGRVARNTDGPLAAEFSRLLQEMQIGMGRTDAMRAMAQRTSLADLKSFCLAMVQADSLGIPVGRVLRVQSAEMRTKRRQRAEEKAQQVPVRIMIPLVLFILPCLFIVILGPAGIQIADVFMSQ